MSEDHGDDLNFNDLVGSLLSSHNANGDSGTSEIESQNDTSHGYDEKNADVNSVMGADHPEVDLPELGVEEEDDDALAAVVASAIQNMDNEQPEGKEEQDKLPRDDTLPVIDHRPSLAPEVESQQQQDWAQILQQSILQATDTGKSDNSHPEDQLDQDDENLRQAILESLHELNTTGKEHTDNHGTRAEDKGKSKKAPKKSSKKKKKDKGKDKEHQKDKRVSTKKKKHHKKVEETSDDNDNLLDFEDVIKGFMQQQENDSSEGGAPQTDEIGDAETQALVEATLKAFERELLGPQQAVTSPSENHKSSKKKAATVKTTTSTSSKKKESVKKTDAKNKSTTVVNKTSIEPDTTSMVPPDTSRKKKKKKKQQKVLDKSKSKESYEEDEFSRALAEMVNEVVNNSLSETVTPAAEVTKVSQQEPASKSTPSEVSLALENQETGHGDETFDLNQIMQKAMSMAFQEQNNETLDTSVMEEFNRGLGDLSVSDLLGTGPPSSKKRSSAKTSKNLSKPKKSAAQAVTQTEPTIASSISVSAQKRRTPKPPPSSEEILRKRYAQAAIAAASAARKRISASNKASRLQQRSERRKAREERKLLRKQAKEKLELERKELEEIVAKGPPYPSDLRLTKSGRPKKPYRRWTQEEMEKRASMPLEETEKPKKVKKPRKKKSKKLKRVPLSTLRKIPLFNFVKGNVSTQVKDKLNGIDDTLKRIPLEAYHLDINKLAPPETVAPEDWEKERNIKEEDNFNQRARKVVPFAFDAGRKTVVRREKIPFHPPWTIPSRVPFALPVARRRRKEKSKGTKYLGNNFKERRNSKQARSSLAFSVRNRVIPAVLFPIINTLKAAARAKAASGASPDEASKHLATIIRHTKKSIAQTLNLARRQSLRDYSTIKSEDDLIKSSMTHASKTTRIPIFSLSKIKQIDTSEDSLPKRRDELSTDQAPSLVKIEDDEASKVFNQESEKEAARKEATFDGDVNAVPADPEQSKKTRECTILKDFNKAEPVHSENIQISKAEEVNINQEAAKNVSDIEHTSTDSELVTTVSEGKDYKQNQNIDQRKDVTEVEANDNPYDVEKPLDVNNGTSGNDASISHIPKSVTLNGLKSKEPSSRDSQQWGIQSLKGNTDAQQSLNLIKEAVDQSEVKGEEKVHNVLDNFVKQHLTQSRDNGMDLPPSVQHIISATIKELIPSIEEETEPDDQPQRKRHRRGPPPVLNLDGLVPPNSLHIIPKIEEVPNSAVVKPSPRVRKMRKRAEQQTLLYSFDVPDFKNMQGRRTMLLKRAKEHLTSDEMNILKKEINKERKRKWREVNVEKNWENDLRARLRKRANAKFGEGDTIEKTKWFKDELAKSLAERGIKEEQDKSNDESSTKKNLGSTNLSDNEVLNMIATTLNKLETARLLERELNEEASNFPLIKSTRRKEVEIPQQKSTPRESIEQTAALTIGAPSYNEQTNDNITDEIDESGNTKRPYPDDIPVTGSFLCDR